MFTTNNYESAYCVKCHRDRLWVSLLCDREGRTDNGPEHEGDLASRYEGRCIKCCGHNHG